VQSRKYRNILGRHIAMEIQTVHVNQVHRVFLERILY